jgi:hypothetical protein
VNAGMMIESGVGDTLSLSRFARDHSRPDPVGAFALWKVPL